MKNRFRKKASALVTTLFVVVVLSTIVMAFMASMSLERKISGSMKNKFQAELAAEAGLNELAAKIEAETRSDDFIVVTGNATLADSIFPVNYVGTLGNGSITYTPLFSGGSTVKFTAPVGSIVNQVPDSSQAFQPPPEDIATDQLSLLPHLDDDGTQKINVGWIPIKNSNDEVIAKYSYWAEDLGGYLDADTSGSKPLVRGNGTSASELGLFTLFRPTENKDSNPATGPDAKLIGNRTITLQGGNMSALFTGKTLGFFGIGDGLNAAGNYEPSSNYQRFFATGLKSLEEPEIVPRGFGYSEAGKPKKKMNDLIQKGGDEAVKNISDWILANMPNFNNRGGGFPASQNYAKTIAANIIDYADADNDATVGVDYRGVDSYPFLTQFYQQFTWVNEGSLTANPWIRKDGTWQAKIRYNLHIQLWNPTNQPITNGSYKIDMTPLPEGVQTIGQKYSAWHSGSEIFKFKDLPPGTPQSVFTIPLSSFQMQANEYKAWSSSDIIYWLDTGISQTEPAPNFGANSAARPIISEAGGSGSAGQTFYGIGYRIYWNDKLVDQPGSITHSSTGNQGIEAQSGRLDRHPANGGNGPTWRGAQPSLRHGNTTAPNGMTPTETAHYLLGDPRGSFYIKDFMQAHDYDENASWWGRHMIPAASTSNAKLHFYAESRLRAWPDGAHETTPAYGVANAAPGTAAASVRTKTSLTPNQIPASDRPDLISSRAPAKISNSGNLTSLMELGNIYDPLCWKPSFNDLNPKTFESVEKAWREVGKKENSMVADFNYTTPSTLRIGRSEFYPLDKPGLRASQILDLFTLNSTSPKLGKININTASRDVLRTLGAGITISSDPDIMPNSLKPSSDGLFGPFLEKQADKLAEAIIQSRPFLSTSQLPNIQLDGEPFFGNPGMWTTSKPTSWNDSAAEEYFRKIYGLVTVRNRNFRVFVTGVALNPTTGQVLSRSQKVYTILIEPTRDENQSITSQQIKITYKND